MDHPTQRFDSPPEDAGGDQPTRRLEGPGGAPPAALCPECRGPMVWAWTRASGQDDTLEVERIVGDPIWGQPRRRRTTCGALVCVECGFTKLYARDPKKLLEP